MIHVCAANMTINHGISMTEDSCSYLKLGILILM